MQSTATKVKSPAQCGRANKRKGNKAEVLYAARFRELGFDKCRTSRQGSKLLDDCAVDLMFLPILAQIKAGRQAGMNPSKVLMDIEQRIAKNFPANAPEQTMPRVMIHYKNATLIKDGRKIRTPYDELVTMTFETFIKFLIPYQNDLSGKFTKS